jgi:hypothetical protein
MIPYLLQRCTFKKEFDKNETFDRNVSCDYMGSSEFEWGAWPKSLRAVCADLSAYEWFKHPTVEHIHYFAKQQDSELEQFIEAHCGQKYPQGFHTKERTCLYDAVKETPQSLINIWWDIENHVFIVYDKQITDATQRLDIILANLKKKYDKKG